MATEPTPDRRESVQRRQVMAVLLRAVEDAGAMTPKEVVVALRCMQLTQAKAPGSDEVRAVVSDALARAADRIEVIA